VFGDVPQVARTAPIDEATVKRSLLKLGDTPYAARNVDIDLDEGLMMPVSALNAIRREAVERLVGRTDAERVPTQTAQRSAPAAKRKACRAAMFYEPDCIPKSAYEYFDILYTPLEKYTGSTNGVALPSVIFDSERENVRQMLFDAKKRGAEHVLVGNLGHLSLARESGLRIHGDIRLNAVNSSTVAYLEALGIEDVVLLPELSMAQMRDIGGKSYALVYGRAPLMITEKCVGKESGGCDACNSGKTVLTDRRGVEFPVRRRWKHRSVIFNSLPIYMGDSAEILRVNGLSMQHFVFTTESKNEVKTILFCSQDGKGFPFGECRRIK
jgi:putative protease